MISEKQVEHVIVPMPHDYFVTIVPNIIILLLTVALIVFYKRKSTDVKERRMARHQLTDGIRSTCSLPDLRVDSRQRWLPHRTKSLMLFPPLAPRSARTKKLAMAQERYLSFR